MSTQYISGHETFDDGDVQARNKANANAARDAEFARELVEFFFPGEVAANAIFGKIVFTHDVYVTALVFNAHFGPPSGQSLIAKLKVNGVTQAQEYTLPADSTYAKVNTDSETDIAVTAGQALEIFFSQVGSTSKGENVKVWVLMRKVKLT